MENNSGSTAAEAFTYTGYKPGDKIDLFLDGEKYQIVVKKITTVGFSKEYFVEFEDKSCKWMREHELSYVLN